MEGQITGPGRMRMRTWGPEVGRLSAAQGGLASRSTRIRSLDLLSWLFACDFWPPLSVQAGGWAWIDLESWPWLEEQKLYDFYRTWELRSE